MRRKQNRYKSILCQEDTYCLELVRYIHLNPLRSGDYQKVDEGIGNHPERVGRQIEDDPAGYQQRGSAGRRAGKRASAQADGLVSYNIMNVIY